MPGYSTWPQFSDFFRPDNLLKPSGSFPDLSWSLLVLGGRWTSGNRWFFGSDLSDSQNQRLLPEIKETPHPGSPALVRTGGEANRQFDMCRDTNLPAQSVSSTGHDNGKKFMCDGTWIWGRQFVAWFLYRRLGGGRGQGFKKRLGTYLGYLFFFLINSTLTRKKLKLKLKPRMYSTLVLCITSQEFIHVSK